MQDLDRQEILVSLNLDPRPTAPLLTDHTLHVQPSAFKNDSNLHVGRMMRVQQHF